MNKSLIAGLMSGTSLDGLDIAICEFNMHGENLDWQIVKADTISYDKAWSKKLQNAHQKRAIDLLKLHQEYGEFLGSSVLSFLTQSGIPKADIAAISSHGHTVFHQPESKLTFQLGHGASIAAVSGLPVFCDFRVQDVVLGGQGAPLVPVGDRLLFGKYDFCLNLGGIANVSMEDKGRRVAWDICPANMVLNYLSRQMGQAFDNKGTCSAQGTVVRDLLNELNQLQYYSKPAPKTLGREWVEREVLPLLEHYEIPIGDKLATFTEHVAIQISKAIDNYNGSNILITGGGAFNDFLINRINKWANVSVILPEQQIIDYKEALIFALLGYLKMHNQQNVFGAVTGAKKDHISGVEYKI